jgi:CTP:molybdopterin cytidylyltransferase MocA
MTPVALVIASDAGSGFDGPKYLASLGRSGLLQSVLDDVGSWPVAETYVVLGSDAEAVAADLRGDATIVIDPEWAEGFAASLRVGLDTIDRGPEVDAVIVARGDQPGIDRSIVERLVAAWAEDRPNAVIPKYRYARGYPVVLGEDLRHRLMGVEGDIGLVDFLGSHQDRVTEIWFDRLPPLEIMSVDDLPIGRRR